MKKHIKRYNKNIAKYIQELFIGRDISMNKNLIDKNSRIFNKGTGNGDGSGVGSGLSMGIHGDYFISNFGFGYDRISNDSSGDGIGIGSGYEDGSGICDDFDLNDIGIGYDYNS